MQTISPDDRSSVPRWFFAVGGLQTAQARLPINKAIELHRLVNYPPPEQLRLGLLDLTTAGFMAHYGEAIIQHELIFDAAKFADYEEVMQTAGLVIAALRIRTAADVICPAVCERSWSGLQANPGGERCLAYRVDQVMLDHSLNAFAITPEDLDWVATSLGPLWELSVEKKEDDARFAAAVEALCSYLHAGNYRMMAAQLWAGVEAIFDVQMEVKYRIATLAARLLEPHGAECRKKYQWVKKLYDERSKVVHGKRISEEKLQTHVAEVRSLLAQLLARLITLRKVPSQEEFEDLVFLPEKR